MGPTLTEISAAADLLRGVMVHTPILRLNTAGWDRLPAADVTIKLELFQQAGSFKARGAFLGIAGLTDGQRAAGVIAASGGNHAMAVAWAAAEAGVQATIAMPKATDPLRIDGTRALGAEVVLADDMPAAFAVMEKGADAGKTLMHPFEAAHMTLGAATLGAEYVAQAPDLDTFVIPVGGGGMISGMASAIRQLRKDALIIGVEPVGADSMSRSLAAGAPVTLERIDTIADSLGAPKALPYSFGVTAANVDRMVQISDDAMRKAMRILFTKLSLVAEPACAASLAAIMGPLRDDLRGRKVGIIACGSNISLARFQELTG
ncbi:threonine dehydratase [Cognatiyoonia koreensis]|uniref:Threonine dehydratase n=1 Tax=Cognatiyoonia koreensis TaxID=364200 RepID=A0A1I0NNG8_9RHOB|nr:threonine/serine dehydratase [Cognatiyoonia koreensis]SEW02746.1 threonine dehydratase [Cognatiyoonia koreensis]